jgi:hypothetical protein
MPNASRSQPRTRKLGIEKNGNILASSAADLNKNLGQYMEETSAEDAAKERKDLEI